ETLPRALTAAANKAMVKKADQRYQHARQFKADLDRVLGAGLPDAETIVGKNPESVPSDPAVATRQAGQHNARRTVLIATATGGLLCLIAIAGMAVVVFGKPSATPPEPRAAKAAPVTVGQQRTWESPDVVEETQDVSTVESSAATGFVTAV